MPIYEEDGLGAFRGLVAAVVILLMLVGAALAVATILDRYTNDGGGAQAGAVIGGAVKAGGL